MPHNVFKEFLLNRQELPIYPSPDSLESAVDAFYEHFPNHINTIIPLLATFFNGVIKEIKYE
ncbi:Uncharacterised protein [Oligella urethralis]|uniref:hypothetical protein n=1 Tax=Oligella urethralis TaxID=90245 RepID=UPI000E045E93|nr:hypothetical protein [Oligella urethralis]SUA63390.1 Uncharacterised protein [Oligella urethralis]